MAAIDYPSNLPAPSQSGYSRTRDWGFETSEPDSGPLYKRRRTFDVWDRYPITWQNLSEGEAFALDRFVRITLDNGLKPFNMEVYSDGVLIEREVKFIRAPQITGTNALTTSYSAEIYSREVSTPYDALSSEWEQYLVAQEGSILDGMAELDRIVNVEFPS